MLDIIITVTPVFLIIILGALLKAFKIANDKWIEILNNFALYVGFPALIFSSLTSLKVETSVNYSLFLYNTLILLTVFGVVAIISRIISKTDEITNCYIIGMIWGNAAYLGYPYINAVIPGSGPEVIIVVASYIFTVFTFGLWILESSLNKQASVLVILKSIYRSPLLIAVVIGVIFVQFNIFVPVIIDRAIKMLATASSPVVLIALGIFTIKKIELSKKLLHAVIITTIKLIVLPAIFLVLYSIFSKGRKFMNISQMISILEAGMPTAVTLFALTERYPLDKTITVYLIIISTVISMISLPIFTMLVG